MVEEVLTSKYFPNSDLFHPKNVDKPSYTWSTAKALKKDFWWQVGEENRVDILYDSWGFEDLNGDSINSYGSHVHERKMPKLWIVNHMG
ncbi:hypothetical protein J1N35_025442 [Gossypium stocksii]|uniref:Uncharacterized protein n=1 Tax=Gossypium stocksii TaxID=47602 RepID=A0A9D3ZXU6_9ROSI|nr:hypothetical protein J1N35_025442 [Gossypium stocksii]